MIVVCCWVARTQKWNVVCHVTVTQGHNKPITALTVTADQRDIYTASSDGNICIHWTHTRTRTHFTMHHWVKLAMLTPAARTDRLAGLWFSHTDGCCLAPLTLKLLSSVLKIESYEFNVIECLVKGVGCTLSTKVLRYLDGTFTGAQEQFWPDVLPAATNESYRYRRGWTQS